MKEGFLIGGGLIVAGLALQLCVGQVVWDAFAWPVNGIVLAGFIALVTVIYLLRKKVYGCQFIGTYQAAIPALTYAVILTITMGLTRQETNGTWLNDIFVILAVRDHLCVYGHHPGTGHPAPCAASHQLEARHPHHAEPPGTLPCHDNGLPGQCRHATAEDDHGYRRARVAGTDNEWYREGDAFED